MYSLSQLYKGVKTPRLISGELKVRYISALRKLKYLRTGVDYYKDGIDVFDEDWDFLILLDACRYDMFKSTSEIPGKLEKRRSRGSMSAEWVRGNFRNKKLDDTVYVSANYWYEGLKKGLNSRVHQFIAVERDAFDGVTSRPETVTESAKQAYNEYPNKRLIIHYMQPHPPFFKSNGTEWFRLPSAEKRDVREKKSPNIHLIRRAYLETLKLVLEEVRELLEYFEGRTVVSADHGELLGEWLIPGIFRKYDHPEGYHVDELLEVPWHIYESGDRREIIPEKSEKDVETTPDLERVKENLEDLGYLR